MIKVSALNDSSPVKIAQDELVSYLNKMGIESTSSNVDADICLGLFEDFGLSASIEDAKFDDEFEIKVSDGCGFIAGSNPRSVLYGAYRFLEENGARWVRPGKNGDYLPKIDKLLDVSVREAAAHRHRTICIEGAASFENLMDMINWMPKLHFNEYFFQFTTVKAFLDRWYHHVFSTVKPPEMEVTEEFAQECTDKLKNRVRELGLFMILGGHCFTNEPFGVTFSGWDPNEDSDMPPEFLDICAELDGHRGLWKKMVVATQLCYSRPEVREVITNSAVDFLKKYPETDILSFCLSDGSDNTCECEACTSKRYSDFYVMMLNDIDRKLTEEGIDVKIAHESYNNLFWPPMTERLNNPDRFIMMYCPSKRNRTQSWPHEYTVKEIPEYKVNGFCENPPFEAGECLAYLYQWLQTCPTDTFIFDYHLMWDHLLDAGNEAVAKVLYEDSQAFRSLKIQGLISCQLHRNFFPSSIAMTAMGKSLWRPEIPYEDIQRELYSATFGEENAEIIKDYMETLSACFDMALIRGLIPCDKDDFKARMNKAIATMEAFKPTIMANQDKTQPCQKTAWAALILHAELYTGVAKAVIARLDGEDALADQILKDTYHHAFLHEDEVQEQLDTHFFCDVIRQRVTPKTPEQFSKKLNFDDAITQGE